MGARERIERILGIRSDKEIEMEVEQEAPIRAARRQLARADKLLVPLQFREDLERANSQRKRRRWDD